MARMCAGVVPQHPPTKLTSPCSANSRSTWAMCSGVSSYWPNSFGSPAFGCALTYTGATRESSCTYWRSCTAPSAQLRPTLRGRAWATEYQNASAVCPESVRPLASTIVPEIMTGSRNPSRSNSDSMANSAAFALRVSKMVSTSRRSAPPSTRPWAPSPYVATSWSNVTFRNPGSFTSGDSEALRLVGPSTPATKRGGPG